MSRRTCVLPLLALAVAAPACAAGPSHALVDLTAQVQSLQGEQSRQAHRIDLLENRVVLAEDSARLARQALVGVGPHRSISIGEDGVGTHEEAIRSTVAPGSYEDVPVESPNEARPLVHAQGRERMPGENSANPIVVHDDDRLPVAPVPMPSSPMPGRGPMPQQADPPAGATMPASSLPDELHPGLSSARDPRATRAYEDAVAMARGGRCPAARDALSAFIVRWPDHPWADHAMYWRAECMLSSGDARQAVSELEGLVSRFPAGEKVPDALFSLVGAYRTLGDEARARATTARLLRDFPRSGGAERLRAAGDTGAHAALEIRR